MAGITNGWFGGVTRKVSNKVFGWNRLFEALPTWRKCGAAVGGAPLPQLLLLAARGSSYFHPVRQFPIDGASGTPNHYQRTSRTDSALR
ncbi:MAG: hypothetical protein DYG96_07780 [Chlorobi bacterium CHB2]|nr:hypothetical protein [Chlorobi bacterium CHB2]